MTTADDSGMLSRVMRVLGCFTADEDELGASRLAELSGLSPSTLHRITSQMIDHGLLVRVAGRRYALGERLFELGELSPLSLRLRETALPHMQRLYEATGENVHLAVLDRDDPRGAAALFVGRVTGHGSIPTLTRMGGRQALHAVGTGKAMLAAQADDWIDEYLRWPLLHETVHTLVTPEQIRADIEATRSRGFAVAREEMTLGNVSIGVTLGSVPGLPLAALGVVVEMDRADERRLGALVRQSAADLTRALRA
ncbi:MAG: IclR family transcriptional regulator [Microbacterium sp.]